MPINRKDLCFIDLETTGSRFGYHEIIEIAVVRTCCDANTLKLEWSRKISPRFPERITDVARSINGFSQDSWPKEHSTNAFWREFLDLVEGCVPVCHNPSFERAFISLAAAEVGFYELGLDYHWIGTESLAWSLVKRQLIDKFSLDSLCMHFGLEPEMHPHSAMTGAETCLRVYRQLMRLYEKLPTNLAP